MRPGNLLKNDDAVSISIGFILMFGVTVLMFTGIIFSFYALSQSSEKSAMRESFRTMGSGLSAKITMLDTLVNITNSYGGTVNTLEYEFSMPASIAGKVYTVNITNPTYEIIMEADDGARIVSPFNITSGFAEIKLYSGAEKYELTYNKSGGGLNIKEQ